MLRSHPGPLFDQQFATCVLLIIARDCASSVTLAVPITSNFNPSPRSPKTQEQLSQVDLPMLRAIGSQGQ
ncbi:hypothetical protein SPRG_03137 [Saprolegnia parasitica CBS 223.65]|uniref:Uncharacterized protein n=1 Tax=Saprolegnia parasitica (strain CBS 223.65) TaxID=695850 RepID=A0A067CZG8_SAPPC|nr:hypothetical protein SPRG_03137 [Saprolegnia parasitica CBS 223.65]KDO31921.1 hypothetical protein SPRG_03137 [Saprolegnia parasitica CBS 223.65]|eukprot:XP_012197120.1 hypothetical protein SPRG_03137 [Saprolegnia parasitica CBS 223.65]